MTRPVSSSPGFTTVFGRELVSELPNFVHRPYLVVTMADLWPTFETRLDQQHLAGVHLVDTLELADLEKAAADLPAHAGIVGLGGGQALDVAKFFAWTNRRPLFQVPTATTVNAPFGHRSGVRDRAGSAISAGRSPRPSMSTSTSSSRRRRPSTAAASATFSATGPPTRTGGWRTRSARPSGSGPMTRTSSPRRPSSSTA